MGIRDEYEKRRQEAKKSKESGDALAAHFKRLQARDREYFNSQAQPFRDHLAQNGVSAEIEEMVRMLAEQGLLPQVGEIFIEEETSARYVSPLTDGKHNKITDPLFVAIRNLDAKGIRERQTTISAYGVRIDWVSGSVDILSKRRANGLALCLESYEPSIVYGRVYGRTGGSTPDERTETIDPNNLYAKLVDIMTR